MTEAVFFDLALAPYPSLSNTRAWNSADTQLVEIGRELSISPRNILVANDEFGALSVATGAATLWTDSWLANHASQLNLKRNQKPAIKTVWSCNRAELETLDIKLVLLRVPKQLAYLEYQLSVLNAVLSPGIPVLAAGMDKHLFANTAALLEHYIGPTQRLRGKRKARAFHAIRGDHRVSLVSGQSEVLCDGVGGLLQSLANGFAREKIDLGSRFFIENMDGLPTVETTIDLACGNGVMGLNVLKSGLTQNVVFCDESAMAQAAAKTNAIRHAQKSCVEFHHGDGLVGYREAPAELIICNPPFHHNHRVEASVGRRLISQSAHHLRPGGSLCIVANRHLDYLATLKRGFSKVEKLTQNNKFILWLAHR